MMEVGPRPAIRKRLGEHPRFYMHFTPTYSSWINQVERWFGCITEQLIRRGDHRSVQALEADIRNWIKAWNDDPKPFIWTKTAEQILTQSEDLCNESMAQDTSCMCGTEGPGMRSHHIAFGEE
jgi:hypothetical protein